MVNSTDSCSRHILAICHFKINLRRDERKTELGKTQIKVVYPKFKNCEATVKSVRVAPKFGMIVLQSITITSYFTSCSIFLVYNQHLEMYISLLDYVEEIYQQMIHASKQELENTCTELVKMPPSYEHNVIEGIKRRGCTKNEPAKQNGCSQCSTNCRYMLWGNTILICLHVRLALCMFAQKIDNIVHNLLYNRWHSWYFLVETSKN